MDKTNSRRFLRGCAGKTKHKTFLGAEYALFDNTNNSNADIYKCKDCGFFHIGTRANKKNNSPKVISKKKEDNGHNKKYRTIGKMKY